MQKSQSRFAMADVKYLRSSQECLDAQSEARERFNHVVIDLKQQLSRSHDSLALPETTPKQDESVSESRRSSLKTLEWISGKVDLMRRKFSAAAASSTESSRLASPKKPAFRPRVHEGVMESSQSRAARGTLDGGLLTLCEAYRQCGRNSYTVISAGFDTIVATFAALVEPTHITIHHQPDEQPRGILLFPLNDVTGQALVDFAELGGFSVGRGSQMVKQANHLLSRSHCMIYLENGRVLVKDCDSRSGTFLCGRLLGSSVPTELRNFDIVQLGYDVVVGEERQSSGATNKAVQFLVVFLAGWDAAALAGSLHRPVMSHSPTLSQSMLALPSDDPIGSPRLTEISAHSPSGKPVSEAGNWSINTDAIRSAPQSPMKKLERDEKWHASQTVPNTPRLRPGRSGEIVFHDYRGAGAVSHATERLTGESVSHAVKELTDSLSRTVLQQPDHSVSQSAKRNLSRSMTDVQQKDAGETTPLTVDVAALLKTQNIKIPAVSPMLAYLQSVPRAGPGHFTLPVGKGRFERLERLRDKTQHHHTVTGNNVRFESLVDFGLFSSDVSEGAGETRRRGGLSALRYVFNNYRVAWQMEAINEATGHTLRLEKRESRGYTLSVEKGGGRQLVPLGTLSMDMTRFVARLCFDALDDVTVAQLEGRTTEEPSSSALRQLSYFYPHLEVPVVVLNGPPDADGRPATLHLQTSRESRPLGQLFFVRHKTDWTRHNLYWALDLMTDGVVIDSVLMDAINATVLLYCLRYHLD